MPKKAAAVAAIAMLGIVSVQSIYLLQPNTTEHNISNSGAVDHDFAVNLAKMKRHFPYS